MLNALRSSNALKLYKSAYTAKFDIELEVEVQKGPVVLIFANCPSSIAPPGSPVQPVSFVAPVLGLFQSVVPACFNLPPATFVPPKY